MSDYKPSPLICQRQTHILLKEYGKASPSKADTFGHHRHIHLRLLLSPLPRIVTTSPRIVTIAENEVTIVTLTSAENGAAFILRSLSGRLPTRLKTPDPSADRQNADHSPRNFIFCHWHCHSHSHCWKLPLTPAGPSVDMYRECCLKYNFHHLPPHHQSPLQVQASISRSSSSRTNIAIIIITITNLAVLETVVELETIKEFGDFSSRAFFTIGILPPAVYYFEDLWQK